MLSTVFRQKHSYPKPDTHSWELQKMVSARRLERRWWWLLMMHSGACQHSNCLVVTLLGILQLCVFLARMLIPKLLLFCRSTLDRDTDVKDACTCTRHQSHDSSDSGKREPHCLADNGCCGGGTGRRLGKFAAASWADQPALSARLAGTGMRERYGRSL